MGGRADADDDGVLLLRRPMRWCTGQPLPFASTKAGWRDLVSVSERLETPRGHRFSSASMASTPPSPSPKDPHKHGPFPLATPNTVALGPSPRSWHRPIPTPKLHHCAVRAGHAGDCSAAAKDGPSRAPAVRSVCSHYCELDSADHQAETETWRAQSERESESERSSRNARTEPAHSCLPYEMGT